MNHNPYTFSVQPRQWNQKVVSLNHIRLVRVEEIHVRTIGAEQSSEDQVDFCICQAAKPPYQQVIVEKNQRQA